MRLLRNATLSPEAIQMRKKEILWVALERALDDVMQGNQNQANAILVFKHVQAAFTKQMGMIDIESVEHRVMQDYVNALDVMILTMEEDGRAGMNIVITNTMGQP